MWTPLFPGVREEHVPIGHVTNGVHVHTWLAPQMRQVYERHLGADWTARSARRRPLGSHRRHRRWRVVGGASDAEGAAGRRVHARRRRAAGGAARSSRRESSRSCGASLSRDALTIGFARRFATYKRANLLLQDLEALDSARQRSADAGAVRLRRQGASARRAGQGGAAGDRQARRAIRDSPARSSSSRTTTSTSAAIWSRASTCG